MKHPPNELCECHDCHVARRTTVLPYMGKPKDTPEQAKRKNWKPVRVVTDGTRRTLPKPPHE